MMKTYICIVYDSINNSVFQSQVLAPLIARKKEEPELDIRIVSFEKDIQINVPKLSDITFHIFKRHSFVHHFALLPNIIRLRYLLRNFARYELLARGPFAGYIAYHAANNRCSHITIQARGLVAEEYLYTLKSKTLNLFERYRYTQFLNLEKKVYSFYSSYIHFETVSPALKEYLIKTFTTNPKMITVATNDIPLPISQEQKTAFRKAVRKELSIEDNIPVYCYSGSHKPWQCPQKTIDYFKNIHRLNPQAVLLILTPDIQQFETTVMQAALPPKTYRIKSVPQKKLLNYLAAADFGLLLREAHIINFVSRPTKALEYVAAGLTVLHNDTVTYLKTLPATKRRV